MTEKFHVEHFLKIRLIILGLFVIGALGCRSEDPQPEARDLIYQDLKKELDATQKALEEAKKAKTVAYEKMRAAPALTMDLKEAEKEYWKATKMVDSLIIASEYLQIRTERRRVESRESYHKAFLAHKEDQWPDADEYSGYLTNKRLRERALLKAHREKAKEKEEKRETASVEE